MRHVSPMPGPLGRLGGPEPIWFTFPPRSSTSQTRFIMKRPVGNTPPSIARHRLAIGGADSVFESEQERPLTSCDGGCRSPPTR